MLGWLLEARKTQKLMLSELEMPELLWQMLKKDNKGLRERDMLEWIYYGKPENAPANGVP